MNDVSTLLVYGPCNGDLENYTDEDEHRVEEDQHWFLRLHDAAADDGWDQNYESGEPEQGFDCRDLDIP